MNIFGGPRRYHEGKPRPSSPASGRSATWRCGGLDGPMTGRTVRAYAEQFLAMALKPGEVVHPLFAVLHSVSRSHRAGFRSSPQHGFAMISGRGSMRSCSLCLALRPAGRADQAVGRYGAVDGACRGALAPAAGGAGALEQRLPTLSPMDQDPGRSRGGFSSKLHAVTDAPGKPLRCRLTAGQKGAAPQASGVLDATAVLRARR